MRRSALLLPASIAMMLIACGDKSEAGPSGQDDPINVAPTASITSHAAGDTERQGYPFALTGSVADADNSSAELQVTWTADGNILCEAAAPAEDGTSTCDADLAPGDVEIAMEVVDPSGDSAAASVSLTVNPTDAPTAEITSPDTNGVFYSNYEVDLVAVVGDTEDDIGDLVVEWTSSLNPGVALDIEVDSDGTVTGSVLLAAGSHVLTLSVTDTSGNTAQSSVDITVAADNNAPVCAIGTPLSGSNHLEGASISFAGSAADADLDSTSLDIVWTSDVDGVLSTDSAAADGSVSFATGALSLGDHNVTLTATDERGEACEATVSTFVGQAPVAIIDGPADGETFDEGRDISFAGTVNDLEDGVTDLDILWQTAEGVTLDTTSADSDGLAGFSTAELGWGEYTVIFSVTDSHGFQSSDEIDIIVNGLPSAPTISLASTDVNTTSDLVINIDADAVDPEGDTVTHLYSWSVDGVPSTLSTTATLPASATTRGETWSVAVSGMDARVAGPSTEVSVTIGNAAPAMTGVALSPSDVSVTEDIVCSPTSSDADGDSISHTFAWSIDGIAVSETSNTLAAGSALAGQTVVCTVTPNDGLDDGAALASTGLIVGNAAPEISAVDLSASAPTTDESIVCSVTSSDVDGDSLTTSYTWLVNGTDAGVSGDTLDPSFFFKGDSVVCEATVDDGTDSSAPVASAAATISNSTPTISSAIVGPSPAKIADDLTCAVVSDDADGDTVALTYAWTVNSTSAASTSATLATGNFSKGDAVTCTATPDDGTDTGAAVTSAALTISNTAPTVKTLVLGPTSPTSADTLTCTATGADADHDGVGFRYSWLVDGVDAGITSSTLGPAYHARGSVVTCTVEPYDSTESGPTRTSAARTITNGSPSVDSIAISPASVYAGDTLSCDTVGTDPDGDAVTMTFAWSINGADAGITTSTLSTGFSKTDVVTCSATPTDGTAVGSVATSASITVSNSAPELTGIALSPTTAYTNNTLTCAPSATDGDGDTVTYSYDWTVNGANVGVPTATLLSSNFDRDDVVRCTVVPTDGSTPGTSDFAQITIANSAPVLSSASISNSSPTTDTVLSVGGASSDLDGDTVSMTWDWYVNGLSVQNSASSSLAGVTFFDRGDTVYAIGTPSDGSLSGTPVTTASVTVGNTAPTAPLVLIDPADPTEDDDLLCIIDDASTDADGDTISYTISWEVDGVAWAGATSTTAIAGDTISYVDTLGDEEWVCTAVPSDGTASGSFGDDVVIVLPIERVYDIDAVDLLTGGASCNGTEGTDANRYYIGTDMGFDWMDEDTRTPVAITVDIGWGWDCDALFIGATTKDVQFNGASVDSIPLVGSDCTCTATDSIEFVHSTTINPVDYLVDDVNEVRFPASTGPLNYQALSRMATLDGFYGRVTVEY